METVPHTAERRARPTGFARVAAVLACLFLAGLITLPPGGLETIAALPVESVPLGEEGGSEPELASAAVRRAHLTPNATRSLAARSPHARPVAVSATAAQFPPLSGRCPARFHLRC